MGLSSTPITPVAGTPNFYPPQSGTGVLAADVQAGLQATADWVAYLRGGAYLDTQQVALDTGGDPPWGAWIISITGTTAYTLVTGTSLTWTNVAIGDLLIVNGVADVSLVNNTNAACYGFTRIKGSEDFAGTPVNFSGGLGIVAPGFVIGTGSHVMSLPCSYQRTITKAGTLRIGLYGAVSDATEALVVANAWIGATLIRRVST